MTEQSARRTDDDAVRVPEPAAVPTRPIPALAEVVPISPLQRSSSNFIRPGQVTHQSLITRNWKLIIPAFIAAIALVAGSSLSLPSLGSAALMISAMGAAGLSRVFLRHEDGLVDQPVLRHGAKLLVVGVPMLLFGIGAALWATQRSGAAWPDVVGVLVVLSIVASILLSGRHASVITAVVGLWTGVSLVVGSPGTFIALFAGGGAGIYAAIRQARQEAIAAAEQRHRMRAQQRAEEILSDYEQTGQGWFWETDRRGTINYVSSTVGDILRRDPGSLAGRPFSELFNLDAQSRESERSLSFHLSARSSFQELAVRAASTIEERWWSISGRPIFDDFNNFIGFRGSGTDLTEKRRSDEHASRLAHYDSLTGLANRFQMSQTLEKILAAPHVDHRTCAVFLLDLDRFKQVNDTMGHPAGDALLKQVAQRLERTVDKVGRVGRLGGDEFQIVLPGRIRREDLAALAARIIEDLSQPYSIEGHRVVIGASLGIALSPHDGVTSEALIRNADLALYAAKDSGRGRFHFYAEDLHSDAEERRQLEQDLRDAISNGGLELHYQPVVHTVTERITGFEALLRWTHPTKGPMSPAKFIPVAEDAGLIAQIGEWALRTACHDLAKFPNGVRVAVNVSPLQFANPALPAIVTHALAAAQVDPARLELEITESVFLNEGENTDAMFAALKRVGVRLALDDFGTGYSSLGYLKKAPFDKIKIDQSFVRGATIAGSRNGAIIAAIVSLAEALGMETSAEGVETLDELDLVRMLGCSHVQGYIYEKALSADAARSKLASGLTAIAQGPRSARASRQMMLRKVVLDHGGQQYHATIRNISSTGALVEGLWNVPPGTIFRILFGAGQIVTATARWCQDDRLGVEFAVPLALDEGGRMALIASPLPTASRAPLARKPA